jgi:hypothetical protein
MEQAIAAIGPGGDLLDTLKSLKKNGVIESFDVVVEMKIMRDKAAAIENFFMLQTYEEATPIKKRKKTND